MAFNSKSTFKHEVYQESSKEGIIATSLPSPYDIEQNLASRIGYATQFRADETPPADGGREAWKFMIGAFMVEGLMWGFPLTFGVFQNYYQRSETFENGEHLPIVGTLATGISYLGTPLIAPLTIKYPRYQRRFICGGWLTCILALIASSFATQVWHLIVSQGFLYGIGFLVTYYSVLSMLNEWFIKRRGLAYGILFGSAGIYGLGLPFVIEIMLKRYGYATTLRAYAVAIFVLIGPSLLLLRGRFSWRAVAADENKFDARILGKKTFIAVSFSNLFQGLVFFLPSIYLPSYASASGLSTSQGTLILSILNVAQIIGQLGTGFVSDRFDPILPMVGSTLCSAVIVLCVWGFSTSFAPLLIFGFTYGLFAGGYSVLYCRFATTLTDQRASGLWLYSIFEFQRGAGNIIGGPVSGLLTNTSLVATGYGVVKYERLVLFVGIAFLIGSLGGIGWFSKGRKQIPR